MQAFVMVLKEYLFQFTTLSCHLHTKIHCTLFGFLNHSNLLAGLLISNIFILVSIVCLIFAFNCFIICMGMEKAGLCCVCVGRDVLARGLITPIFTNYFFSAIVIKVIAFLSVYGRTRTSKWYLCISPLQSIFFLRVTNIGLSKIIKY